jgi:hypothetical protein
VEQAEGYVKALEKSTSRLSTMRKVFEHHAQSNHKTSSLGRHISLVALTLVPTPSKLVISNKASKDAYDA